MSDEDIAKRTENRGGQDNSVSRVNQVKFPSRNWDNSPDYTSTSTEAYPVGSGGKEFRA
jgi:hypothetical protein